MEERCTHFPNTFFAILHTTLVLMNVTRLRAGRPGFDSRQGLGLFVIATAFRPALGPT